MLITQTAEFLVLPSRCKEPRQNAQGFQPFSMPLKQAGKPDSRHQLICSVAGTVDLRPVLMIR